MLDKSYQKRKRPTVKAIIADDCNMFRSLLKIFMETECDVEVVGSASDGQEAIELIRTHLPDVAILDLSMPNGNGFTISRQSKAIAPQTKTILLTGHPELQVLGREPSVDYSLTKDAGLTQLMEAIQLVFGQSNEIVVAQEQQAMETLKATFKLTTLEFLVVDRIMGAESSSQIALSLTKLTKNKVTEDSVKQALRRAMDKMGVEPRTRVAVVQAVRNFTETLATSTPNP